eukprot:CAMPEP_0174822018 /NCGR_PEP_ID=MMETSP1107-20130205/12579_1 /TAXON_ID=36770 /ORGANISM="Paraphysomonas vestita, Strain GFlagA" /LENGTH=302 /DNA_ID=CAMNT_0016039879 /DNA_START=77 /DNA_END=982 /DNA_ORIENTATION=-
MLIAGSWDTTVTCYELQYSNDGKISNVIPQSQIKHDGPVFCTDIASDGMTVFSGGADNTVRMWNPTQGTTTQTIGTHDKPVRSVKVLPDLNLIVSASWDKTLRLWDARQPNPVHTIPLTDRAFCMDAAGPAIVACTGDRKIHVFDLTPGHNFNKIIEYESPMNYQTRCVSIFHDRAGFALGCVEGRVAIENFSSLGVKSAQNPNFVYKCHRTKRNDSAADVYSVNAISFNHMNTFCTAGSDGILSYWDKEARSKLKQFEQLKQKAPITDCKFSPMGNILVYSACYDWSMGKDRANPSIGVNI